MGSVETVSRHHVGRRKLSTVVFDGTRSASDLCVVAYSGIKTTLIVDVRSQVGCDTPSQFRALLWKTGCGLGHCVYGALDGSQRTLEYAPGRLVGLEG